MRRGMQTQASFSIRPATVADVPLILQLIRDLAIYEKAPGDVTATEPQLREVLFGDKPAAEVLLGFEGANSVGFAVFFHNFSTWLGRPDFTWKTCSSIRNIVAKATGEPCSSISPKSRRSAAAGEWSGPFWIGTIPRFNFTESSARNRWMSGPCSV